MGKDPTYWFLPLWGSGPYARALPKVAPVRSAATRPPPPRCAPSLRAWPSGFIPLPPPPHLVRSRHIRNGDGVYWPTAPADGCGAAACDKSLRRRRSRLATAWHALSRGCAFSVGVPACGYALMPTYVPTRHMYMQMHMHTLRSRAGSGGEHVCDNVHLLDNNCGSDSESA